MRGLRFASLAVFILALSALITLGQATNPGPPSAEPGSSAGPNGTMNDDAALRQPSQAVQGQIQDELIKNNLNNVTVNVTRSRIDLGGTVASKSQHDQALQIARSIGQKNRQIVDHITLGGGSR